MNIETTPYGPPSKRRFWLEQVLLTADFVAISTRAGEADMA